MKNNDYINKYGKQFKVDRKTTTFNKLYPHLITHFNLYSIQYKNYETEEIISKTIIKIWNKIDLYNNKYEFTTWINAIYKNTFMDQLREQKKHLRIKNLKILIKYDKITYNNGKELIKDIIRDLEKPYNTLLYLLFIKDKSYKYIMDFMNIKYKTQYYRYRTEGIKILRDKLKKNKEICNFTC